MMSDMYELCAGYAHFFNYEFYEVAVKRLRELLQSEPEHERWAAVVEIIHNRRLAAGEPLDLVHYAANLPLVENTDEEAYRWLDLMIRNAERPNGRIEEYFPTSIILLPEEFQKPSDD